MAARSTPQHPDQQVDAPQRGRPATHALWTHERCNKYEKMLRRVKLVPNLKKSIRERAGTFCEQLAVLKPDQIRIVQDHGAPVRLSTAKSESSCAPPPLKPNQTPEHFDPSPHSRQVERSLPDGTVVHITDTSIPEKRRRDFLARRALRAARPASIARMQYQHLTARSMFRIGECSGAKSIEGQRGHAVVDDLNKIAGGYPPSGWLRTPKPVKMLASRTAKRCRLTNAPGRIAHGGGGDGQADATTAADFILAGRTSTREIRSTTAERLASRFRNETVLGAANDPKGIRIADALALRAARDNQRADVYDDAWMYRARAKRASRQDHAKRAQCRRRTAAKIGPKSRKTFQTEVICHRKSKRHVHNAILQNQ